MTASQLRIVVAHVTLFPSDLAFEFKMSKLDPPWDGTVLGAAPQKQAANFFPSFCQAFGGEAHSASIAYFLESRETQSCDCEKP